MIKTPLSIALGGAFWTPGAVQIGSSSKNLSQLIKSLFSLGEQGFAYDPNNLNTLYQDAAGTIPVTAAGQPVGLMLDKSKELSAGINIFNIAAVTYQGTAYRTGDVFTIKGADGIASVRVPVEFGKYVELDFEVISSNGATSGLYLSPAPGSSLYFRAAGRFTIKVACMNVGNLISFVREGLSTNIEFKIHSVREIKGNHAYQTQSAMRPLLVANPQQLDYDTADDNLITNLPAELTGCTVIRSVPNVGTQILTDQTIPATYNDNTDHCGLIVINRALTASEASQITKLFNKAAGV